MFPFPIIIRPLPDEMTFSYIKRLAEANGFSSSMPRFLSNFFIDSIREIRNPDCFDYLQNLDACTGGEMTIRQLLSVTTLLPAVWPMLSEARQSYYIQEIVRYPEILMHRQLNRLSGDLCYCPECRKNDLSLYGSWYFHRVHHLPGVAYCPNHHVRLLKFRDDQPLDTDVSIEQQTCYQKFEISLLDHWMPCSFSQVKQALVERAREETSRSVYAWMLERLAEKGFGSFYDAMSLSSALSGAECGIPLEKLFILLGLVFDDAADLKTDIVLVSYEETVRQRAEKCGYTVMSPYDHVLMTFRHDECGTVFQTNPKSFISGFRCPACDKKLSQNELFKRVVSEMTESAYEAASEYSGVNRKAEFKHLKCGTTFSCRTKAFMFYGVRCPCERQYTDTQLAEKVAQTGPFTLLESDGMDGKAKIRAEKCGHIFNVCLRKFLKSPYCRICFPKESNSNMFKREIRDLVGNDYRLMGGYIDRTTPVTLKHMICGREFRMNPIVFLNGQRCPYCKKQILKKDFSEMVEKLSSGRYKVIEFSTKTRCRLIDRETGAIMEFERGFVAQELTRPTPSKKLPHETVAKEEYAFTTADKVMQAVRRAYKNNDLIVTTGIYIDGMTKKQIGRVMYQQLTKHGKLLRLDKGVLCYADADMDEIYKKLEEIHHENEK